MDKKWKKEQTENLTHLSISITKFVNILVNLGNYLLVCQKWMYIKEISMTKKICRSNMPESKELTHSR